MDCINDTSRLGRNFFAEGTTGSCLYYERVDVDFPAHDKTTLLSFPCRCTLPFPLIGAITACREDFHRMQLFTINTIKRILQRGRVNPPTFTAKSLFTSAIIFIAPPASQSISTCLLSCLLQHDFFDQPFHCIILFAKSFHINLQINR